MVPPATSTPRGTSYVASPRAHLDHELVPHAPIFSLCKLGQQGKGGQGKV